MNQIALPASRQSAKRRYTMSFDKSEYESDFKAAMQTELRLNREARAKPVERTPPRRSITMLPTT